MLCFGAEYPEFEYEVTKHFAYMSLASLCEDKTGVADHGFGGMVSGGRVCAEDRWKMVVQDVENYAETFGSDLEVAGLYNLFLQAFNFAMVSPGKDARKPILSKLSSMIGMHKARLLLVNR